MQSTTCSSFCPSFASVTSTGSQFVVCAAAMASLVLLSVPLARAVPVAPSRPPFSWDTLPVFFHSANASGPWSEAAVKQISRCVQQIALNDLCTRVACAIACTAAQYVVARHWLDATPHGIVCTKQTNELFAWLREPHRCRLVLPDCTCLHGCT